MNTACKNEEHRTERKEWASINVPSWWRFVKERRGANSQDETQMETVVQAPLSFLKSQTESFTSFPKPLLARRLGKCEKDQFHPGRDIQSWPPSGKPKLQFSLFWCDSLSPGRQHFRFGTFPEHWTQGGTSSNSRTGHRRIKCASQRRISRQPYH